MRVFSKAKLAAKRAAVKGVPKSTCDLPLGEGEAVSRKPILVSRTKEIRSPEKREERKSNCKYCENRVLLLLCLTMRPQLHL